MNAIEDLRIRFRTRFSGSAKPSKSWEISSAFRNTANDMPRFPQSSIPEPKPRYDRVGRPPKGTRPEPQPFRKKPKDIFGGWL